MLRTTQVITTCVVCCVVQTSSSSSIAFKKDTALTSCSTEGDLVLGQCNIGPGDQTTQSQANVWIDNQGIRRLPENPRAS
jgi:hypothetical protein